jgi:ferric-dicitrate binding protein FerR (iron transport regulator)
MVALRRGEVMFDVPQDSSRPFQLTVCGRVIELQHARFNVRRLAPGRCEITVMAGAVNILHPRFSAARTPAQLRDSLHYSYGEVTLLAMDGGVFGPGWQSISKLTEVQARPRAVHR